MVFGQLVMLCSAVLRCAEAHAVLCWGTRSAVLRHTPPPPCLSTALHRHGQLAKYHPVPWLRWHNVSWHQVFRLPEGWASIMPAIWSSESIMNLPWIYRESIANLAWICRESSMNLSQMPAAEELNLWKSRNLVWNGSIWFDMSSY